MLAPIKGCINPGGDAGLPDVTKEELLHGSDKASKERWKESAEVE